MPADLKVWKPIAVLLLAAAKCKTLGTRTGKGWVMKTARFLRMLAASMVASSLFGNVGAAPSEDKETWDEARAASCPELLDAYKETVIAERKVVAAIHDSKTETIATNVVGAALLAGVGVGFFTWNDSESAEENLADLRNDLRIIRTVSSEKKCALPAEADIK